MDNTVYWLWLQKAIGYGKRIDEIINYFGSAKAFYEASEMDYRISGLLGEKGNSFNSNLDNVLDKSLSRFEHIIAECNKLSVSILTPESEYYPKSLLNIPDFCAALFVKGDLNCLNAPLKLAVIGSRSPTEYSVSAAKRIASDLAKGDAVIVSGGALGIDSIGHRAALENGRKTVLVMGCGHNCVYLQANRELRESVCENGAVISEYPPYTEPFAASFPLRNRIISALSDGIFIIEAGERSGTLNTANHAIRQGKDIFVLPGSIDSPAYSGSNRLISEKIAKPVFSADDVLSNYGFIIRAKKEIQAKSGSEPFKGIDTVSEEYRNNIKKPKVKKEKKDLKAREVKEDLNTVNKKTVEKITDFSSLAISKNAALVYNILLDGKSRIDEIVQSSSLPVAKVLSALTELEISGIVTKSESNDYLVN